jgi:hypothetical protein
MKCSYSQLSPRTALSKQGFARISDRIRHGTVEPFFPLSVGVREQLSIIARYFLQVSPAFICATTDVGKNAKLLRH